MFLKNKIKKSDMSPTETFPFLTNGEVTRKFKQGCFLPKNANLNKVHTKTPKNGLYDVINQ